MGDCEPTETMDFNDGCFNLGSSVMLEAAFKV